MINRNIFFNNLTAGMRKAVFFQIYFNIAIKVFNEVWFPLIMQLQIKNISYSKTSALEEQLHASVWQEYNNKTLKEN